MPKTWVADVFEYRDGKLFWKISPCNWIKQGDEAGSTRKDGYVEVGYKGKSYLRHKLVYALHTGEWPDLIDHKDNVPGNDLIDNLRPLDKHLNGHNSNKSRGEIPFRGVSFDKTRVKFVAYCKVNTNATS